MYIHSLLVHVKENLMHYHLRSDMHQYQTRSKDTLDTPCVLLSKSINSYNYLGIKLLNELPSQAKQCPTRSFKYRLKKMAYQAHFLQ